MDILNMDVQQPRSIRDLVRLNKYSSGSSPKGFHSPAPPASSPVDPGAYASYGCVVDELQWLLGLARLRTGAQPVPTDGAAHGCEPRRPSGSGSGLLGDYEAMLPRNSWLQMDAQRVAVPSRAAFKEPASPPAPNTPTASQRSSRHCTAFMRDLAARCPSSAPAGSPLRRRPCHELEPQDGTEDPDPWLAIIWQRIDALRALLAQPL